MTNEPDPDDRDQGDDLPEIEDDGFITPRHYLTSPHLRDCE